MSTEETIRTSLDTEQWYSLTQIEELTGLKRETARKWLDVMVGRGQIVVKRDWPNVTTTDRTARGGLPPNFFKLVSVEPNRSTFTIVLETIEAMVREAIAARQAVVQQVVT